MRLSTRTKATFAAAAAMSMVGAVAWAQNLEVKGNAWFATGGSGSAGIGTATPLAKLHVIAPGGFGAENAEGISQVGDVPIIAQSDGTGFGLLNASGRQLFAISVEGNTGTTSARGYLNFYDKSDGTWRNSLALYKGNAGVGTLPQYRLDVAGDVHATGSLRTEGTSGWISQTYGGGWYMSDPYWIRAYGDRSVWTGAGLLSSNGGLTVGYGGAASAVGGAIINGSVGIGTSSPSFKLHVNGAIAAGNSDIYFTNTAHNSTGIGNTAGYAAIENSATPGTLMILGRAGASIGGGLTGRRVDVSDYLQVNGRVRATAGTLVYLSPPCAGSVLTTSTTISCCMVYDSATNSCSWYDAVATSPLGRLVDF